MPSTRDRILDALDELLPAVGPAGATLEMVAARAEVSKGGLLYHFGTKEALFSGYLARLEEAAAVEVGRMRSAGDAAVETFLDLSTLSGDLFTRTFVNALSLVGAPEVDAAGVLASVLESYREAIGESVEDPVLARLVQLVGDGLYLHAMVGTSRPEVDREVIARVVAMSRGEAQIS